MNAWGDAWTAERTAVVATRDILMDNDGVDTEEVFHAGRTISTGYISLVRWRGPVESTSVLLDINNYRLLWSPWCRSVRLRSWCAIGVWWRSTVSLWGWSTVWLRGWSAVSMSMGCHTSGSRGFSTRFWDIFGGFTRWKRYFYIFCIYRRLSLLRGGLNIIE